MRSLLCFLFSFGLLACPPTRSGDDDDSAGDDDDASDDDDTPGVEPMQLCASIATTSTVVTTWRIDGDVLTAETWRSGGCEDWAYDLCWDGFFLESFPVQVQLYLQEFGEPDPCEAEVTETLQFSLVPLQDAYVDGYGPGSADILVNMSAGQQVYSF